jgi:Icc protein
LKIAHISDLHHASSFFVQKWANNVIRTINSEEPDLLIVTGDLTDNGYANEFEMAKAFLDRLEVRNKIILPGNHDARNLGYTIFEEMFGDRFPTYCDDQVAVVGLDSTEPDVDDGHIGREHYDAIRKNLSVDRIRIIALHHHLIPIPGTGRERQIPTDAGDVLGLCKEVGVNFVLSGHKHLPWIWNLDGTYFITTGTATTRRLKGRSNPAFGLLEIAEGEAVLRQVNVDTNEGREVLRTTLGKE